ncbi:M20/M25/M40 family metallo-hydrolase [Tepidibacillus fermentans]|uniref:M42 glutamyl aminopeptidase n=1 Tax=Tepidibacillus fermentans TaxID=1281767 RepID=A0A4R3KKR8_9BACI|nr:M20/M25/M40 family metallo-hydrolase [Tepidibacillus fermentans]TCS84491.1 M42 glutamyl aminopeptidase [Tepidibacillus fermentans]
MLTEEDAITATKLLQVTGIHRVIIRGRQIHLHVKNQKDLLDAAEKLHLIQREWVNEEIEFIQRQFFYNTLEKLLSINGRSGEEEVRQYVKEQLMEKVDHLTVDHSGNILAQKTYRSGKGPTILLSAHLDLVEELEKDREIIKDGTIWSSNKGILGADDRAGVAVLLEMAKRLETSNFNGKVKYIFTVEEEMGLLGAKSVNEYFLWDVDVAIVIDRRGTGDIVVSAGSYFSFCHKNYGEFFEKVAKDKGLNGWKTTPGGSSDTKVWAENGIQSVNLSAGYMNEHTEDETLDVEACYNVVKLLDGVFEQGRQMQQVLRRIKTLQKCR